MGPSTTETLFTKESSGCDNPSKWGLQQQEHAKIQITSSCDNPSKWGLQQREKYKSYFSIVVITPQNGVFNNT